MSRLLQYTSNFSRRTIPPIVRRAFHSKIAEYTSINEQGSLSTAQINVWIGDPHETYVLVPVEIGNQIKRSSDMQRGTSLASDQGICPMIFHHQSQHFSLDNSIPYPQIKIPQNLPSTMGEDTSSATLYLFGATHTLVLDGTPDATMTKHLRESLQELRRPLDRLKDM